MHEPRAALYIPSPEVAQDDWNLEVFTTLSVQAGFSNHQHPEPALGRLDVIYVSGTTAEAVFTGCVDKAIASGIVVSTSARRSWA